jgi:hypothetical protein
MVSVFSFWVCKESNMTRDDIIRMAVECQLVTTTNRDGIYIEALERFANLVAAAEREKDTALLRQCLESLILGAAIYPKESSIRPVFDTAITALLALLEGEQ